MLCIYEDFRVYIISIFVSIDIWGVICNFRIFKIEILVKGRVVRCKKKILWFGELIRILVGKLFGGIEFRYSI